MEQTLDIGSIIIIDGIAWTVDAFRGDALAHARSEEHQKAIWFTRAEAKFLGAGLFGLPGRIEPPAVNPAASVVANVAKADIGVN